MELFWFLVSLYFTKQNIFIFTKYFGKRCDNPFFSPLYDSPERIKNMWSSHAKLIRIKAKEVKTKFEDSIKYTVIGYVPVAAKKVRILDHLFQSDNRWYFQDFANNDGNRTGFWSVRLKFIILGNLWNTFYLAQFDWKSLLEVRKYLVIKLTVHQIDRNNIPFGNRNRRVLEVHLRNFRSTLFNVSKRMTVFGLLDELWFVSLDILLAVRNTIIGSIK